MLTFMITLVRNGALYTLPVPSRDLPLRWQSTCVDYFVCLYLHVSCACLALGLCFSHSALRGFDATAMKFAVKGVTL